MKATNALRGIFALMIVWHHLISQIDVTFDFDFGNTIVLFFYILSGFGITLSWKDKIEGNGRTFIKKRIKTIFPLYLLILLPFIIFDIDVFWRSSIPFHLTLTQSWLPYWQINHALNLPSWFLSSLFFCYLTTPGLFKILNRNPKIFITIFLTYLICYNIILFILPSEIGTRWIGYKSPSLRIIDYTFGVLLALVWKNISIKKFDVNKMVYTFIEILLLIFILAIMYKPICSDFNKYTFLRYPLIGFLIIIFTISKGYISSKFLSLKILQWVGNLSLSIYLIHYLVLKLIFSNILFEVEDSVYLKIFIVYVTVVLAAILFQNYLLPFFNNIIRLISVKINSLYNL